MDFKLNKYQEEAVTHIDGPCLVTSCPGSGKCITGDSLVCSNDRLISSIEDNLVDNVVGLSSEDLSNISTSNKKISEFVDSGLQKTIRITTRNGYSLEGTYHHPIVILNRYGDFEWKKLKDIKEKDVGIIWVNNKEDFCYEVDEKYYLVGLLIGDGCLVLDGGAISFSSEGNNVAQAFCRIVKKEYNYDCNIYKDKRRKNLFSYYINSINIKNKIKECFGDVFHYACDKYLTSEILNSSKSQIASVIRGIYDADGSVSDHCCDLILCSKKLIDQIHVLLLHYGVFSTKSIKSVNGKNYYRIQIYGNNYRRFVENIGFGHVNKLKISEKILLKNKNSNQIIPFLQVKMSKILKDLSSENPEWYDRKNQTLLCSSGNIRMARYRATGVKNTRNITENSVNRIKDIFNNNNYVDKNFEDIKGLNCYCYSEIAKKEYVDKKKHVYDYVVPETHSFIANGFINHNTRVLTERASHLIKQGIKQKNILCLTFTNKAANEMKGRVCKKLGVDKLDFFVGTFHSLCARMLRKIGPGNGVNSNFNILDEKDQSDLIFQIARKMECEIEYGQARHVANCLNYYRDQMEDFDWVEDALKVDPLIEVAEKYIEHCDKNSLLDFSALIYKTIKIIESDEDLKRKIQNTFKYIMVDETQDTNKAQFYLVNLLGGKWKNIMLIGDTDQCVIEGEQVLTVEGYKKIEELERGEEVISASGGGKYTPSRILNTYEKWVVTKPIVKVKTKSGKTMTMTKEHMIFADYLKISPKKVIVYLMFDREFGYRIGVTNTKRKQRVNGNGLGARLQQERAEYLWILKAVDTVDEAKYWEQYYSIYYGIPTWCFYSQKKQRGLDYSDNSIKKLFSSIDTSGNASRIMNDLWLFPDRPHYIPKCMGKNKRRNFSINMCADSRSGTLHRYMISGSDDKEGEKLKNIGLNVRGLCKGRRGWRVESAWKSIEKIYDILELTEKAIGKVNIIEKARFCEESLSLMPSSHLREGMGVYVKKDDEICLDIVDSVEFDFYTGNVYDIDVDYYHNFITNGIVSHNSVYRWRGARYQNIQQFLDDYDDCRVISLSKNYRSTPQIVKHASQLIKRNSSHMGTKFETDNPDGEKVRCYSFNDQLTEASWVGRTAKRFIDEGGWNPQDIAVLYRVNKMSEPIEQAMVSNGVPYEVIGAWNFYDRKEVRDCLSMLKFLSNSKDGIAFARVCSFVKGMGNITIGKIENLAQEKNISIIEACNEMKDSVKSVKIKKACENISSIYSDNWDYNNPAKCLKNLIDKFDYESHLSDKFGNSFLERKENLTQLIDSAGEYSGEDGGLSRYLQQVSLVTNNDKKKDGNKLSMMSLHSAKGLEFPIVFLIGVEDDILPHKMAMADDPYEGLEEERRLCFVGMTRAKNILFASWCKKRRRFGKFGSMTSNKCKPSRFLFESGLIKK